jgi:GDPmannose 4,6-dehydratase
MSLDHVGLNWQDYVVIDPTFYWPDEAVQLVGNTAKIKKQLSWKPEYSFQQLAQLMIDRDLQELSDNIINPKMQLISHLN